MIVQQTGNVAILAAIFFGDRKLIRLYLAESAAELERLRRPNEAAGA